MALTITGFGDIKYVIGESGRIQDFQLSPAVSDYPTSGYPITASAVELGKLVAAQITGTNAAGELYSANFVFPSTSFTPPAPANQVNLVVYQGSTQVAAGTNLNGISWLASFRGW